MYNKEEEDVEETSPVGTGTGRRKRKKKPVLRSSGFGATPAGYGIYQPKFLRASDVDENIFYPLGITYGRFKPLGDVGGSAYSDNGTEYARTVLAKLKSLGYENAYSVSDIRAYVTSVARAHLIYDFISTIRTLADNIDKHTAVPVKTFCEAAITGKMIARQRSLKKTLVNLPFPKQFVDCIHDGLGCTTLSDNPNSPIRAFAPKEIQPDDGRAIEASDLITEIEAASSNVFGTDTNVELAAILDKVFDAGADLPEYHSEAYRYNGHMVNNLLNLPNWYGAGPSYSPFYASNEVCPVFFRRSLEWQGLLTYSPDNDFLTPPDAGTVWQITDSLLDTTSQSMMVDNDGVQYNTDNDDKMFQSFGTIWEADLNLSILPGVHPTVTRVFATMDSVAIGMADKLLVL